MMTTHGSCHLLGIQGNCLPKNLHPPLSHKESDASEVSCSICNTLIIHEWHNPRCILREKAQLSIVDVFITTPTQNSRLTITIVKFEIQKIWSRIISVQHTLIPLHSSFLHTITTSLPSWVWCQAWSEFGVHEAFNEAQLGNLSISKDRTWILWNFEWSLPTKWAPQRGSGCKSQGVFVESKALGNFARCILEKETRKTVGLTSCYGNPPINCLTTGTSHKAAGKWFFHRMLMIYHYILVEGVQSLGLEWAAKYIWIIFCQPWPVSCAA